MDTPITVRNIVNLASFIMVVVGIYYVVVWINRSYEDNYWQGHSAGYEQAVDDCLSKDITNEYGFFTGSKEQAFYEKCLSVKFKIKQ